MSHLKIIASNIFAEPRHVTAKDVCLKALGWSKPRNAICPVHPEMMIEVHTAGALRLAGKAKIFNWYPLGDITHYRPLPVDTIEHIHIIELPIQETK